MSKLETFQEDQTFLNNRRLLNELGYVLLIDSYVSREYKQTSYQAIVLPAREAEQVADDINSNYVRELSREAFLGFCFLFPSDILVTRETLPISSYEYDDRIRQAFDPVTAVWRAALVHDIDLFDFMSD